MSNTFCPLPWTHLSTHPIGEVTLCCLSENKDSIGSAKNEFDKQPLSLNNSKIESLINSDSFKKARLEMLNGIRPKACSKCFQSEDKGAKSRRKEEIKENYFGFNEAKSITKKDGMIPLSFKKIELRLGNKCNLKCTTCNPASSSSWIKEYTEISRDKEIQVGVDYSSLEEEMFQWPEKESFWEDLLQYSQEVELININGGEPMLYTKQVKFLTYFIDNNLSQNITLEYNINLSTLTDEITSLWKNFKKVIVKCSIDDIGDRSSFIRYPLKWDKLLMNLKKLFTLEIEIQILQTLSIYNFMTLEEVYSTVIALNKNVLYSINMVTEPFFLSPLSIPPDERKKKLKEIFGVLPYKEHSRLVNLFYNNDYDHKNLKMFNRYNSILLKNRKHNFKNDFSRLYNIVDKYLENSI